MHEVDLYVEEYGAGPLVVLGHGFGGSSRNFRREARALAPGARTVIFDARGHARSDAPDAAAAYEPECFVGDVLRLVERAGADRAIVGGLSMGAGIALRFALEHPDRTRALILAAFPGPGSEVPNSWAHAFADTIDARGLDAAGEEFVWGTRSRFDPEGARLIRSGFLEHQPRALALVLRRLLARQAAVSELAPSLAALDIPVLVVVGTADRVSLGPCRELEGALPRATLVEIEGAGHVVNLARPREFRAAVERFLDGLP